MTEQQAQSPIDDLFRKTLENLPDTPAESGWDTPSDRVWQQVQLNIAAPRKGLSLQSIVLLAALVISLGAGLYWMFSKPAPAPLPPPSVAPVEQPVATPDTPVESVEKQTVTKQKPSTGTNTTAPPSSKPIPPNSSSEPKSKPGLNAAQPLPGSKTLPPNSTEAQKKKPSDQN